MEIVIIIGLILLNGILAMSEIALVSARKARLETEAKRGNKSAGTALKLANEPDKFLSTIQIGITLIGILTGLYSGEALAHNFAVIIAQIPALEPYALGIAKTTIVIIVTYLTLIFGELVPKRIGMGCAEKVSMLVAKPMNFLSLISSPFVWLLSKSTALAVKMTGVDTKEENRVTEEEIKAIVKEGFDGGSGGSTQSGKKVPDECRQHPLPRLIESADQETETYRLRRRWHHAGLLRSD